MINDISSIMKALNKTGNIQGLQTFIMGIVGVAIVLAIGFVVIGELATSTYSCPATHTSFNTSSGLCYNSSGHTSAELSGAGASLTTITTKLGTVPSWIGIIIVVVLASLVLGYFYTRN